LFFYTEATRVRQKNKMLRSLFGGASSNTPGPSLASASDATARRELDISAKITQLNKDLAAYSLQLKSPLSPAAKNTIKQRAMQVLQRKRVHEKQLNQLHGMAMTMENAKFAVESARDNVSIAQALKATTTLMKTQAVNVSDMEDIMDGLQDMLQDADEMNEMMARSYGIDSSVDESMLDAELVGLDEQLALDAELADASGLPSYLSDAGTSTDPMPSNTEALPSVPARCLALLP
jgi:charged multivesicular body protein 5